MAALFAELLRRNKRIILSSDMYLAADQIRSLLSANGLPVGDVPLYVSGDLKVCKGTGRLYRHWIESEGVDPGPRYTSATMPNAILPRPCQWA